MGHWRNDTVGVKPKYKEKEAGPNATLSTKEIPRWLPCDRKLAFLLYISMHFVPFRTCPDRAWGPPSLLYNGYGVLPGGKVRPGCDADPSPPSNAEVKNSVELYPYSP